MPENLNTDEKALYNIMIGNDPEKLYVSFEELINFFDEDPTPLGR